MGVKKNQNDGAIGPRKKFDDSFSRLDTIHQRDGQTDGSWTDTGRQQRPRLRIASRGRNERICCVNFLQYILMSHLCIYITTFRAAIM